MGESMSDENDVYYCDDCEEPIEVNDESYEVKYGFICRGCLERG